MAWKRKEQGPESPAYAGFHSEEVEAIMGRRPAWILRRGITVLVVIVAVLLSGCWFIKYPQSVTGVVTLTSDTPPSDLAARTGGILDSVYVSGGDTVCAGQLLALVASTARYEDVLLAEFLLQGGGQTPETARALSSLQLGDLQPAWAEYVSLCRDYEDYLSLDQPGRRQALLWAQVQRSNDYCRRLEEQRRTLSSELSLERRSLGRDSVLLSEGHIAPAEYEMSLKAYLSKEGVLAGFDASLSNARLSVLQLEQQILELETQRLAETSEYERRLGQSRSTLLGRIALWKEQYAIVSPCAGVVSLQNVWGRGQRVLAGELIASVAPSSESPVMGRLKVPSSGFGKVSVGQEVKIKLSGFPYLEFGIVRGTVAAIASVPENTEEGLFYTVDVVLPDGLLSTYRKDLPFVQNMDGTAEIITEDLRLLQQLIRPIRALFADR